MDQVSVGAVILGGGVTGLWTLNELTRRGVTAILLEPYTLGNGQTICSQGIIHGGMKYSLEGILTSSARKITNLPKLWQACLTGAREPSLTRVRVRAEHCHLWSTKDFKSQMSLLGARIGLATTPQSITERECPDALRYLAGKVLRLDEVVIDTSSLIKELATNVLDTILKIDTEKGFRFLGNTNNGVSLEIRNIQACRQVMVTSKYLILTAGEGNSRLREQIGLPVHRMQRRPLHMVMLRGELPMLNGHCVDGAHTRITVTADTDEAGKTVWQLGGQIAEDGVRMSQRELLRHTLSELDTTVPGTVQDNMQCSSYRIDRAEIAMPGGNRPDTFGYLVEDRIITGWPTKLVLAPLLAERIADLVCEGNIVPTDPIALDWPRPAFAVPPWISTQDWQTVSGLRTNG